MCSETTLNKILKEVRNAYEKVYGDKLVKVVLYGSYARGDYDSESDIDIMGFVEDKRERVQKDLKKVWNLCSDLEFENDLLICQNAIPYEEFIKYKEVLPYYRNVEKEGVEISA